LSVIAQERVCEYEQLSHDGRQRELCVFSGIAESVEGFLEMRIAAQRCDCRHVEGDPDLPATTTNAGAPIAAAGSRHDPCSPFFASRPEKLMRGIR